MDFERVTQLSTHYVRDQFLPGESHQFFPGTIPILFSAPHPVEQLRHGKVKRSESYTGGIAELLHIEHGYHALVKTRNHQDDANFDERSSYRDDLKVYVQKHQIQLVIDLHIMSPSHLNTIEMATGNGKNIQDNWKLIEEITQLATSRGVDKVATDLHFFALNPNCIAADVGITCLIPAIQMEINWRDLSTAASFQPIFDFLKSLKDLLPSTT